MNQYFIDTEKKGGIASQLLFLFNVMDYIAGKIDNDQIGNPIRVFYHAKIKSKPDSYQEYLGIGDSFIRFHIKSKKR